jgi:hypothetical protein
LLINNFGIASPARPLHDSLCTIDFLFRSYSWHYLAYPPSSSSSMSFLGGAECSTGANPLSQFTKHVQDDKSLQRDRLVGRGPGGMQEGMRSQQMGGGSDAVGSNTLGGTEQ